MCSNNASHAAEHPDHSRTSCNDAKPATAPLGWKLVPTELTDEMEDAGYPAETAQEGWAAMLAAAPDIVSDTTLALIQLLIARDHAGRSKYGATLDRTDLCTADWLQHLAEELLDGAGYALAAKREASR